MYEDQFAGNDVIVQKMYQCMAQEGLTVFTGAGTSIPECPSWNSLISELASEAKQTGKIDDSEFDAFINDDDQLFIADELSIAFGEQQFKAKVSEKFSKLSTPTELHKILVSTAFSSLITLNYDMGLEIAASEILSTHFSSFFYSNQNQVQELVSGVNGGIEPKVLHWHGVASDPDSLILSGEDYNRLYHQEETYTNTLTRIFTSKRLLLVGFGFSDPFIVTALEKAVRSLSSENLHFAIIGVESIDSGKIRNLRRKFQTKYKLEVIFYPINRDENGNPDHSSMKPILEELQKKHSVDSTLFTAASSDSPIVPANTGTSYYHDLYMIGNRPIYCEPNLYELNADKTSLERVDEISKLIESSQNQLIIAPHEFGLTNLGLRITNDIQKNNGSALFLSATNLPNYKKKLLEVAELIQLSEQSNPSLILDNFLGLDHLKLLRELNASFPSIRIVLLQRQQFDNDEVFPSLSKMGFQRFELRGLNRNNVRTVVQYLLPNENTDNISFVVEKVYEDLTELCIPLTPPNVIMYSKVLCSDGNFTPVSRLQIIERFVNSALERSSDSFSDSFGLENKIRLISCFAFELFERGESTFTHTEWRNFCHRYRTEQLVPFEETEILSDLVSGRIVYKSLNQFYFRYKMFFSFFVGKHIALRKNLLENCLEENKHLSLEGLVEVLCGLALDCGPILDNITDQLEIATSQFYDEYNIDGLDLLEEVKWNPKFADETLWDSVQKNLDSGPSDAQAIDELKSSIASEKKSDDQQVSIINFIVKERNVVDIAQFLTYAVNSAVNANATSKLRAAQAILHSKKLASEVAYIVSPLIAKESMYKFEGFTFYLISNQKEESTPSDFEDKFVQVVFGNPIMIAENALRNLGNKQLSEVFASLIQSSESSVVGLTLYALILRTKPRQWQNIAQGYLDKLERHSIYLFHALEITMEQFQNELNTSSERSILKQLVASIQLRRTSHIKSLSPKVISKTVEKMDAAEYWDQKNK